MSRTRSRSCEVPSAPLPFPTSPGKESARKGSRGALCLWLPTFELRLELVRSPGLDRTSVALLAPGEGVRKEVWQVSERASVQGVRPGQLVSQAVSLCPSLTLLEPDPDHYEAAQEALLEVLSESSPVVEPAGRGRIFVGTDGLGRLFGRPDRQVERVLRSLFRILPRPVVAAVRAGRAPGRFGAWVAATAAGPGRPVLVEEEGLASFLAPCPVSVLPVEARTVERLERLEIGTLGRLAELPAPAVTAQFGEEGARARAWASGERIDPVRPRHRPRPVRASLDFPAPVGQEGILHGALDRLLERALARPERRGRSVAELRLVGRLEGGGSWSVEGVPREPTARRERLAFLLRSRMSLSPPPRAVEGLRVEFRHFGPPSAQEGLFDRKEEDGRGKEGRSLAAGEVPPSLEEAVRELKLRLGASPLYRVVEVDPRSRIPERRHALLPFEP